MLIVSCQPNDERDLEDDAGLEGDAGLEDNAGSEDDAGSEDKAGSEDDPTLTGSREIRDDSVHYDENQNFNDFDSQITDNAFYNTERTTFDQAFHQPDTSISQLVR